MAAGFANTEARARGCARAARSPVRCRQALAVPIFCKVARRSKSSSCFPCMSIFPRPPELCHSLCAPRWQPPELLSASLAETRYLALQETPMARVQAAARVLSALFFT